MFLLRDYQLGDFEELFGIDQECFAKDIAYSRGELQSYIQRKTSFCIVAELAEAAGDESGGPASPSKEPQKRKQTIAGFLVVEYLQRGYGHLITIDVRPAYRRADLGSLLIQSAEERVRKLGGFMMVLETAVNNMGALTFYKRHHYNVLKTLPRYYPNKLDALFLTKRL